MNNDIEDGEVLETEEVASMQKPSDLNYQRMKRPREEPKVKRTRCKYWPGSCHKAQDCPYLHEGYFRDDFIKSPLVESTKSEGFLFAFDNKRQPCKYFHGAGICFSGDSCKFSHVRLTQNIIPKFIRENEAFLQNIQQTQGYTNLGDHYLNYLKEKMQTVPPLLPLPVVISHYAQPSWIPKPPSPDISSRLHASGIIKNRSLTVPKVDINKLKRHVARN